MSKRDRITKQQVKDALMSVDSNLPDGAYWGMVNEFLGLPPDDVLVFEIIGTDPKFFEFTEV